MSGYLGKTTAFNTHLSPLTNINAIVPAAFKRHQTQEREDHKGQQQHTLEAEKQMSNGN